MVLLGGAGCLFILSQPFFERVGSFPIKKVSLPEKLRYTAQVDVEQVVTDEIKEGFFGLSISNIKASLLQIPWIAEAKVQRQWPDTLAIYLGEQQPLARWTDGREEGVLNTVGELFFPSDMNAVNHLPVFYGQRSQIKEMLVNYHLVLEALKPIGFSVSHLEIMPDQGWRAILDNGVVIILGQSELSERLKRFVVAYRSQLASEVRQIAYLDLRYTNGIAIRWKQVS